MVAKSSPKPSQLVGVELRKSTSSLNKALRELPRRLLKWTWPQNSPKIFPEDLQNPFKMTSKRSSRCDHHDILIMISWWRHQEQCINWKTFITRAPDRFRRSEYTHLEGKFMLRFSRGVCIGQRHEFWRKLYWLLGHLLDYWKTSNALKWWAPPFFFFF